MTQEDFNKVIDFYENVIKQQIIKSLEINEIYSIIHPEVENPMGIAYKLKQRAIAVFVQTRKEMVMKSFEDFLKTIDSTDTNEPMDNPSIHIDNPSHSENFYNSDTEDINYKIAELEAELLTCEDSNEKRSLSMRLKHLKKKLNA